MVSNPSNKKITDETERLNSKAYLDVLECKQPQLPNSETYMKFYKQFRPLQKFQEDLFEY